MKAAVVYSTLTGNTKKVAEAVLEGLGDGAEIFEDNGVLVSRGQDRAADGLEEKEWRDRDIVFTIRNGVSDISLDVSVDDGMLADGEMISRLHVFVFAPVFTIPETTDEETSVSLGSTHFTCAGSSVQIVSGLSYGSRVVFVIAEAVDAASGAFIRYYATDPRRTVLKPGVNQLLDLKLVTKSDGSESYTHKIIPHCNLTFHCLSPPVVLPYC